MRRSLRRRCRAASAPSATAAVAADWYQKNEVQARWQRRARFVSFRFVCLSGGGWPKGGMLRWRCVLVAVVVVVVVPFWRELDLKHDADNDDDDADDDTKRAFGDGNFWFDCVKRRRNAMRRCCCCRLLLLFGAPNRRRQRSVLITLLLLLFCCSPLFPPPTHTHKHTHTLPVTNAVIKCAAISLAHTHIRWQRRWLINYNDGCVDGDVDSANLSHALFTLLRYTFVLRSYLARHAKLFEHDRSL